MAMLDPPTHSAQPDEAQPEFQHNGLKLELAPFKLEEILDYHPSSHHPGGHHPVHLHDELGENRRYRVLQKLGHGGFANVWLCRDTQSASPEYVAVKVLLADYSREDCPELRLSKLKDCKSEMQDDGSQLWPFYIATAYFTGVSTDYHAAARTDSTNALLDFTPSNILHPTIGLDGLSEEEILELFGQPRRNQVLRVDSGKAPTELTAPRYLVYPADWAKVNVKYLSQEPRLIDFGESFEASKPPTEFGIPGPYRSPELMLEKSGGLGSDIWAAGCTFFEIRTGRKLFDCFDDDDDDYLIAMCEILGKMPEPWWSTTWENRKNYFKNNARENGQIIGLQEPDEVVVSETKEVRKRSVHPSIAVDARSLKDKLAPGLWYMPNEASTEFHEEISEDEKNIFSELLTSLLAYEPSKRTSAEDAVDHKWFKL